MENEGLIKVLEIYSETNNPVTQNFYQGLCLKSIERIKELEAQLEDYHNAEKFVLTEALPHDEVHCGCVVILRVANKGFKERIKELEEKNEQLEKWQIKPTEAICFTDISCRYKKVFKND